MKGQYVVAIGHKAQSGKDTAADALVEHKGYRKVCFADPVRELTMNLYPSVRHDVALHGWDMAKIRFPHVREALQNVGMACRETFGSGFWANQARDRIIEFLHSGEAVVVPDLRFFSEVDMLRTLGRTMQASVILVRIDRPDRPTITGASHTSEIELDMYQGWDKVYTNDGTVEDLKQFFITGQHLRVEKIR